MRRSNCVANGCLAGSAKVSGLRGLIWMSKANAEWKVASDSSTTIGPLKNLTAVSLAHLRGCSTAAAGGGRYFFNRLLCAVGVNLGPAFGGWMADDDLRDLAGRSCFLVVVPNEDLGPGLYRVFDTIRIEQAAHDPAEDVPAVDERQILTRRANLFDNKTLVFLRWLFVHVPGPAKKSTRTLLKKTVRQWRKVSACCALYASACVGQGFFASSRNTVIVKGASEPECASLATFEVSFKRSWDNGCGRQRNCRESGN